MGSRADPCVELPCPGQHSRGSLPLPPHGAVRALVSYKSTSRTRLPRARQAHPCPGAPEADVRPLCARRGDWLLSFVYRTSSVQLHVAGLQPVLLQDRRVENVDLSSIVSTGAWPPRALRLWGGGRGGDFINQPSKPLPQGH